MLQRLVPLGTIVSLLSAPVSFRTLGVLLLVTLTATRQLFLRLSTSTFALTCLATLTAFR
jgi:hypothetical protein